MTLSDLYGQLFGKNHIQDGDVISMAEHGRIGGISTGQGFKYVGLLNASGSQISSFGGGTQYTEGDTAATPIGNVMMWRDASNALHGAATSLPLPVNIVAGGAGNGAILDGVDSGIKATVFDYANSNPVGVVLRDTNGDYVAVGGGTQYTNNATSPANPVGNAIVFNNAGTINAVSASIPLPTSAMQNGAWSVLATISNTVTSTSAGGSLTAYQGTSPWLVTTATLPVIAEIANSSIPVTQSGIWTAGVSVANQLSVQSLPTLSVFQLGTWTVQPGNTPNTTAWLVTMATLPVLASFSGSIPVAGGSLTSYQGGVWSVLASIPAAQNLSVAGGSLTTYQGSAPWTVLATVSNVLTIQSLPTLSVLQGTTPWSTSNAGGSLTAYQGSAPWSVLATISNSLTVQSLPTLSVYQGGSWTVTNTEVRSSSATVSSVASSATSVSVVASNTSRRAITFYNDCDKSCYLKFGTTASTSSFTIRIFPNGFFSMPFPAYTGAIDGIWEAAPTGSLRVTEY